MARKVIASIALSGLILGGAVTASSAASAAPVPRTTATTPGEQGPTAQATYAVEVATQTDGARDTDPALAGGSLTADRTSGEAGDIVTLTPTVKPGFVFDGYDSYLLSTGASTDGLLTIASDRFALDDKTGSVLIVARFTAATAGPGVLFADDFSGSLNHHGRYQLSDPAGVRVDAGQLLLAQSSGVASAWVRDLDAAQLDAYRIELDIRKASATAGTVQIAFRGDTLTDRYVLALNGSKALIRRFDASGANVELASSLYSFTPTSRHLTIDVTGDTVSVSSDGTPVLSYTNRADGARDSADWSSLPPAFGVLNMTAGAPVAMDNIEVSRELVDVDARAELTVEGQPDAERTAGAVVLSDYRPAPGDTITWEIVAKGGFVPAGVRVNGTTVAGSSYTLPASATGSVVLTADFAPTESAPRTFYIDPAGDDAAAGTSPDAAWRTLAALDRVFAPGDEILLKRGAVFTGAEAALRFEGSGTAVAPILIGAYGEGARPRLDGAGAVENVLALSNQEYIHVTGLEITNLHSGFGTGFELNQNTNRSTALRAINVTARDFGIVRGIELRDLYIHDVNGNLNNKWNGGIFFDVAGIVDDGQLRGIPTKYDGVLIEGNRLERVDRSGIKLVNSAWANQSLTNNPAVPLNWYPSTGIVLRDNQIRYAGGDGITVRDADGTLIERNLVRHARYQNTGYNAGIWPFQATNTVIQYNEVSHTHGVQDGQGLDTDHVSAYSLMQYNYSHNNEGGFMLVMNGFPHTAPTIRYNISQNDADKTFEFSRGTPAGTMIHNNTIHSDSTLVGPRGGVLDLANSGAGTGNREVFIFDNVFSYPAGQTFYVGEAATLKTKVRLFNNAYTGGISVPAEEEQPITGNLALAGLGSAPADSASLSTPRTGENVADHFAGYVPGEGSALVDAAVGVTGMLGHYGGTVTDRRDLSPTALHALARPAQSVDMTAGDLVPRVPGADHGQDFLGTALPEEGRTVGAVQVTVPSSPEPTPEPTPTSTPEPPATHPLEQVLTAIQEFLAWLLEKVKGWSPRR